jgi:ribonuclease BN (tRNA processing enzyme)
VTAPVEIRFLGCGDAFGSGGRFHTCFLVTASNAQFLIDCGASSLIAMRRFGVDANAVGMILLSHLHGDHFGGLPFFLLDAQFVSRRTRPLVIAGPPGTRKRIVEGREVLFPGSAAAELRFPLHVVEMDLERPRRLGEITVTPYPVQHPSGDPPLALRVECAGKVVTYTGDTEWTEALIPAARGADLLIAEAYTFDRKVKYHLDLQTLLAHQKDLQAKRLILTHMGPDVLARLDTLPCEYAEDGKIVAI